MWTASHTQPCCTGRVPATRRPRATPLNGSSQQALHEAAVPRQWSTHGGEDVPVFAKGPLAKALFSGTIDQTFIPHAIAYIACLGEHVERCENLNMSAFAYRPNCAVPGSAFVLASSKYNKNLLQDAESSSSTNEFVQLNSVMSIIIVCTVLVL
ncbi:alkaline phosphatase, germ cell type-like [Nilaparvata lugens]|uniref:alkaline phosphatase, germ cell type-like n=1 Tax=Nilaparvata lugens TaxID=108931 RepID=UPI00193CC174|nr:alkaline phosphatase, germ cell type-like [Nilaparvata lugens]